MKITVKQLRAMIAEAVLAEGLGKMTRGTLEDLKSAEPRFHAYVAAKYRDELDAVVVAFEKGGVFSRKKPHVYVPGKSTDLKGRSIPSPSNDVVVSWEDGRPVHTASAALIDAVRGAT